MSGDPGPMPLTIVKCAGCGAPIGSDAMELTITIATMLPDVSGGTAVKVTAVEQTRRFCVRCGVDVLLRLERVGLAHGGFAELRRRAGNDPMTS